MENFNRIWLSYPQRQNWSSSAWWFFVLLPKCEQGYGPKQLMFAFASKAGKRYGVNHQWQEGMRINREEGDEDRFMTTVSGWINTGEEVIHDTVLEGNLAKSDLQGKVSAWTEKDGKIFGGEISGEFGDFPVLRTEYVGHKASAEWTCTPDPEHPTPLEHNDTKLIRGNVDVVAWHRFYFKGSYTLEDKKIPIEGYGYFQRVLMNIPMFPWMWNYTVFEDKSIISSFAPYIGLHAFRRNTWFFPKFLEKMMWNIKTGGYYYNAKTKVRTAFTKAKIRPVFKKGEEHPGFKVKMKNKDGDWLELEYRSHSKAQFLLDKKRRFFLSRFNYNEFMTKVISIKGIINGEPVGDMGNGWGNMEYTWGLSL